MREFLRNKIKNLFRRKTDKPQPEKPARAQTKSTGPVEHPESTTQNLPQQKMRIEAAKFDVAHPMRDARERRKRISLPQSYGDHKIVAMVRDPWWIYAYWEIDRNKEAEVRNRMKHEGAEPEKAVLRVYDITNIKNFIGSNANSYFDIALTNMAQNWYIDVSRPNTSWCIDIGIISKDGRFYTLARSNYVATPRFGPSEIMDEEWMCTEDEYWRLFGVSGGFGIGKSSMEIKQAFKEHFKEWISSGGVSSFSSFVLSSRK